MNEIPTGENGIWIAPEGTAAAAVTWFPSPGLSGVCPDSFQIEAGDFVALFLNNVAQERGIFTLKILCFFHPLTF